MENFKITIEEQEELQTKFGSKSALFAHLSSQDMILPTIDNSTLVFLIGLYTGKKKALKKSEEIPCEKPTFISVIEMLNFLIKHNCQDYMCDSLLSVKLWAGKPNQVKNVKYRKEYLTRLCNGLRPVEFSKMCQESEEKAQIRQTEVLSVNISRNTNIMKKQVKQSPSQIQEIQKNKMINKIMDYKNKFLGDSEQCILNDFNKQKQQQQQPQIQNDYQPNFQFKEQNSFDTDQQSNGQVNIQLPQFNQAQIPQFMNQVQNPYHNQGQTPYQNQEQMFQMFQQNLQPIPTPPPAPPATPAFDQNQVMIMFKVQEQHAQIMQAMSTQISTLIQEVKSIKNQKKA